MVRRIQKVAVIGSGIMGGGIAALCASAGIPTLLLDIVPFDLKDEEKKEAEKTAFYAEYDSYGPGANPKARAAFSHQLKDLKGYEMESVLSGSDNWNPVANGNALVSIKR